MTQRDDQAPPIRFELHPAEGAWRFRLVVGSETILRSVTSYASPDAAVRAIDGLRGPQARCRACMTVDGAFYFDCSTATGEVIATSHRFEVPRERDEARGLFTRILLGDLVIVRCET